MEHHPLDNFIFTVKTANLPGHVHLHMLSEFVSIPFSITTRHPTARAIPIGSRYSFNQLRDAMKPELDHAGESFEFIVPTGAGTERRFEVHDQASLSRFVGILAANIKDGKLNIASSSFEARLVLFDRRPVLEPGIATPVAPSPAASVTLPVREATPRNHRPPAPQEIIVIEDNEEADGILGYLRGKNLIMGDKVRALAWTFNIDNADKMDMDTTWKVPGMRSEATIAQCAFIYELGRRLREDPSMQGIYNADGVGCGKTFTTLMLLVLRRIASLTRQHVKDYPKQHYSKDPTRSLQDGSRCAFTLLIGVQCVCERNSILSVLLDRLPDSYTVVTCPVAIATVWTSHYTKFIQPAFDGASFPFRGKPVLHGYVWVEKASLQPLGTSPAASIRSFMVEPVVPRTTKSSPCRLSNGPAKSQWSVDELGEALASGSDTEPMAFRRHASFTQERRMSLMIVGRERLSLCASAKATDAWDVVDVWVKTPATPVRVVQVAKCFLLDFSTIICDEAQEYKGKDSNITKAMLGFWARKQRLSQPAPFAVFLSATPAVRDLSDLETASSIINWGQGKHTSVMNALRLADRHSRDRDSSEYRHAIESACKAVERWMISRAGYSPMLNQGYKISLSHPNPETIIKAFAIPEELRQSVREIVDEVRGGILEKTTTVDPSSIEQVMKSVNGADLMWKAGPVPGLQACVKEDRMFPYSKGRVEADIKAYDDAERRSDSAYLQKLDLLTRNDPMFPEMSNIVREASRGKVAYKPDHEVSREPLHILLLTQHPCNAAAAYVYLKENCAGVADVECLLSDTTPTARALRQAQLRSLSEGRNVDQGGKSIVVITTFRLCGFGFNDFVFCNIMIQLGEPQTEASLIQAKGRVARPGQKKETFRFYLKREGSESEELLRIRNQRRAGLCHEDVRHLRLFQGLEFR
ncbi:hypothetical protein FPOAC1_003866 [Fusarium poae]|uniref:hypothetical protein n=1 Tax=Fusarium poae TaxID=36050 RepID=UPI001CEAFB1C|nr:hypothetical protein FPOAC1_003866 [Fusarium poae]KAG8677838.1 hypothetical protein FPOAC1_003866 [Fusarium poae]